MEDVGRRGRGVGKYRWRRWVSSARRWVKLGEFLDRNFDWFLRSVFHSFLDDSAPGFASIPGFSGCRRLIWTDFQTSFDTFISSAPGLDLSEELTVDPN
jgi:hypothetical protein